MGGGHETMHDFDFLIGNWDVRHRKLRKRLARDTRWDEMTIGTLPAPLGKMSRPARSTPAPLNLVSVTSNGMRLPLTCAKRIVPRSQSKVTVLPSGRSVQPSVLIHRPDPAGVSLPVVPSSSRQRSAVPSDGPISRLRPSPRA